MGVRRGFSAIALDNPKNGLNVGATLRAALCYGAGLVVIGGPRRTALMHHPADTMKAYRHIPTIWCKDVFEAIPHDCVPVAVDLLPSATPLPQFVHPERAFYVFGAEDATLGRRITERCAWKVAIPTIHCMNLAACVNVILYDREAKRGEIGLMAESNRRAA